MCPIELMLKANNQQGVVAILAYLKYHPSCLHAQELQNALPVILKRPWIVNSQAFLQYMDSRIISISDMLEEKITFSEFTIDD
jgi:hypothetical protein